MLASGLRMATAIVVLLPVFLFRHRRKAERSLKDQVSELEVRDRLLLLGIGAIGTFGFTLFLFFGMKNAPGAVGAVVMATAPAVTAIGAVLFLKDRVDRWKSLGIILAVVGVAGVNLGSADGDGGNIWLGTALVLGAVGCEAAYTLFGKRLSADMSPLVMTLLAAIIAGLLFFPFALIEGTGADLSEITPGHWIALIWWGAGTMGLGSVVWFHGVMRAPGTTASAFMGVMPVSALLLSYLLLGESFRLVHLLGMLSVLGALAAVTYSDMRSSA